MSKTINTSADGRWYHRNENAAFMEDQPFHYKVSAAMNGKKVDYSGVVSSGKCERTFILVSASDGFKLCLIQICIHEKLMLREICHSIMYIYYSHFDKHNYIDFHRVHCNEPTPLSLDNF